jgi:exonuclease III
VARLRLATFNCENLFARFKFNKNIDPIKAIEDRWSANQTHFDILKEQEEKFTAEAIKTTESDVIALQEIENLHALRQFRNRYLEKQAYDHMMVIDGNDLRFIDVGILSRHPIENIDTHIHEKDGQSRYSLFSRDCLECDVVLPDEKRLSFHKSFQINVQSQGSVQWTQRRKGEENPSGSKSKRNSIGTVSRFIV